MTKEIQYMRCWNCGKRFPDYGDHLCKDCRVKRLNKPAKK